MTEVRWQKTETACPLSSVLCFLCSVLCTFLTPDTRNLKLLLVTSFYIFAGDQDDARHDESGPDQLGK